MSQETEGSLPELMQQQLDNAINYRKTLEENNELLSKKRNALNALANYMTKQYKLEFEDIDSPDIMFRSHYFDIFEDCLGSFSNNDKSDIQKYQIIYPVYFKILNSAIADMENQMAYPEARDKKYDRYDINLAIEEARDQLQILLKHPPEDIKTFDEEKEAELVN